MESIGIHIEPWGKDDLDLLLQCLADPAMMVHLGGPERPEKIAERQADYERAGSRQFKVVDEATGAGVGWVGYWEREWHGEQVFEVGWAVIPAFQGRGIAAAATGDAIAIARDERAVKFMHAYPSVDNGPSNAICRKLGFTLLGSHEYEYPKDSGTTMPCNDWRLDLLPDR